MLDLNFLLKLQLRLRVFLLTLVITLVATATGFALQKSPNDQRLYRLLTLKNGLEVLLISDSDTDNAAAALDVKVGYFADPEQRPGLAHFLEHMLFLGNLKFPQAGEYGHFLSTHGGYSNAYTAQEDTNYFFSVNKNHLEGALDRFAQFFIAPTFNLKFVERELNAVNSEHQKNIKSDFRRSYQVVQSLVNPLHPYHKFGTGNKKTLLNGETDYTILRNQLIQFYQDYYSASKMKLVILGKEKLDRLELYARKYFSAVKRQKTKAQNPEHPPLFTTQLPRIIKIKPIKTVRSLNLMFELPPQRNNYEYKALGLISYLIGDEGVGSVLANLKKRGWATSLSAGAGGDSSDFTVFNIRISLTKEGKKHVQEITATIFRYIDLLKQKKNLLSYYEETQKIAANEFKFKEKDQPAGYVSSLAARLHTVESEHILSAPWIHKEYKQNLVDIILSHLRLDNLQVVLTDPQAETDALEKWYQTPYKVETFNFSVSMDKSNDLSLPPKNQFISDQITTYPLEGDTSEPQLIKDSPTMRVWFKQDPRFKTPKVNLRILLSTKDAYSTVTKAAMTRLFTMLLAEELNQFSYPASVAGLDYGIANSVKGIEIDLSGYPENLPLLFKRIVETAKNLKVKENIFQIQKNRLKESRLNQKFAQAYRRVSYEMQQLLSTPLWHTDEYLKIIDTISSKEQQKFIPELLDNTVIEILVYGNFSSAMTEEITKLLEINFQQPNSGKEKTIVERTVILPPAKPYLYRFQVEDVNSANLLYFQVGPKSVRQSALLALLEQILEKPFYHQLRTLEQLGYITWSGQSRVNNIDGLIFLVQSDNQTAPYVQARVEVFLKKFRDKLTRLSTTEFTAFRQSVIAQKEEEAKTLGEATARAWSTIRDQTYDFQLRKREITALKKLTLDDVVSLYDRIILTPNSTKSINIQAVGKNRTLPAETEEYLIKNRKQFKANLNFYENKISNIERDK
jgi:insulysin